MPTAYRRRAATRRPALLLAALLVVVACAPHRAPRTAPGTSPAALPAISRQTLRLELDRLFGRSEFGRMQWGVQVQSLASGEVLYTRNAGQLMMPASNTKIVTLASAAEVLGWDFRYETRLIANGPIEGGTLRGDLLVVGSGDPSINSRGGASAVRVFEGWADQLAAAGIRRIEGRVVADTRLFGQEGLGAGWAWDYLAYGYAAPFSALQINENLAELVIRPGGQAGAPAGVEVRPAESGLLVDNQVMTSVGGEAALELRRLPGSDRLVVAGTIPAGLREVSRTTSVNEPSRYFVRMLRATLLAKGIAVTGDAVDPTASGEPMPAPSPAAALVVSHQSAPLSEIARVLMKVSQNLYAETFLRTLGAHGGGDGSAGAGLKVVREVLTRWGIPPDAYALVDGSGLSRYNYLCADTLVAILRQVYRDPRHREPFMATLPIGGQDGGTIARRFKATLAEGNVKAKTGSISNVRALSGFVTSRDGEPLVFSIIANSFTLPQESIDRATDLAVEYLANLSR